MEEEHYTDIDMSDIVDESENVGMEFHNLESVDRIENSEATESADISNTEHDSEITNQEEQSTEKKAPNQGSKSEVVRSTRLPMARIKNIMKMDPDVSMVNAEAVFLVTKATELFLETIAKETYSYTSSNKRKIISKKDLDLIINKVDCLCFLEGAMDF